MHVGQYELKALTIIAIACCGVAVSAFAAPLYPPANKPVTLVLQQSGPPSSEVTPPNGWNWYWFANHTHTEFSSDSSIPLDERIRMAAAEGADIVAITDHGNMDACNDPRFVPTDGCIPMRGMEWGSEVDGDAGLLNLTPGPPVGGGTVAEMIPLALARGATIIANHPYVVGEPWKYTDLHLGIHGIEIATTPIYMFAGYARSTTFWNGFLQKGRMVFAIGGSDNHAATPSNLSPANYVLASSPQPDAIQEALEAGRLSVCSANTDAYCIAWADADADGLFETPMGANIITSSAKTVSFRFDVYNGAGYTLNVVTGAGVSQSIVVEGASPWSLVCTAALERDTKDYVRAELRTTLELDPWRASTNPVYINFTPDDADSDGFRDALEQSNGTDYYSADSDNDGVCDGYEAGYDGDPTTYNPFDAIANPTGPDLNAKKADTDGDGLTDLQEILAGSDPREPYDTAQLPASGTAAIAALAALLLGAGLCLIRRGYFDGAQ